MAFSYYRTITIDKTKVPNTDRTDFPVLVSGTYTYLKTTGNGGSVQNANGYDVGFYSDSGLTTKLKWETEKYTATTGEVVYWVKVPTVSTSTDTVIYIAYGDASITTDQSEPTNVWDSNFKGVWHLKDGTTLSLTDSTSNAKNLTNTGTATASTGKIDGSMDTVYSTPSYGSVSNVSTVNDDFTMSIWVKSQSSGGAFDHTTSPFYNGSGSNGYGIGIDQRDSPPSLKFDFNNITYSAPGGTLALNTWGYIVMVRSGGTATMYLNGTAQATTITNTPNTPTGSTYVGANIGAGRNFSGSVDEARFSTTPRSADWILTEYNNQNSPSTFYTVGSETSTGGATVNSNFFQFM